MNEIETPWGPSQSSNEAAPGLTWHTTASHGGLQLSPERWQQLCDAFCFEPWAGVGWLEEDCDASLAIIRWPREFSAELVFFAARQVQAGGSKNYAAAKEWLNSCCGPADAADLWQGMVARGIAADFQRAHAHLWERGGLSSERSGWWVQFTRGKESCEILLQDYPAKTWYSDAELDAFRAGTLAGHAAPTEPGTS